MLMFVYEDYAKIYHRKDQEDRCDWLIDWLIIYFFGATTAMVMWHCIELWCVETCRLLKGRTYATLPRSTRFLASGYDQRISLNKSGGFTCLTEKEHTVSAQWKVFGWGDVVNRLVWCSVRDVKSSPRLTPPVAVQWRSPQSSVRFIPLTTPMLLFIYSTSCFHYWYVSCDTSMLWCEVQCTTLVSTVLSPTTRDVDGTAFTVIPKVFIDTVI